MKPWVYIASPYTLGDTGLNVHFQCAMFDKMMDERVVLPYVPLWSHFQHLTFPRCYTDWIAYDHEIIKKMDGLIRLNAEVVLPQHDYHQATSSGADGEVELALDLRIPVFYDIASLYQWAKHEWPS